MPITPDTKDWTWVVQRRCPECGFESAAFPRQQVGGLIRDNNSQWQELLARPDDLTVRPSDDRWSALEYACHVRDVFRLYRERLQLMLTQDNPTYANWDQDISAVEGRYNEQDPGRVAVELDEAAAHLAEAFDGLGSDQWACTGSRSDGARFTVETFARYMIHDPVHHLYDVNQGLALLKTRPKA